MACMLVSPVSSTVFSVTKANTSLIRSEQQALTTGVSSLASPHSSCASNKFIRSRMVMLSPHTDSKSNNALLWMQ